MVVDVLSRPAYVVLGICVGFAYVFAIVAAENWRLVVDVVLLGSQSFSSKLSVLLYLFPLVGGGRDFESTVLLVALGVFAGVAGALLAYRLRRGTVGLGAGAGGLGAVVGGLGAGCAACGAPVAAAVVGTTAGGAAMSVLGSTWIGVAAVASLALSTFWLADGVADDCSIE